MNHSFEADYFALGVIVYELIFGTVSLILFRDPTWEILGRRLDKKYWPIKLGLTKKICHLGGTLHVLISLTNY